MANYNFDGQVLSNNKVLATSTDVSSNINSAISDLQIGGGVNLYDGTLDFSGEKWGNISEWSNDPGSLFKYNFVFMASNGVYNGLYQDMYANAGEYYTFSGWFRTNSEQILILPFYVYDTNRCDTDVNVYYPKFNENTWTYFAYTFNVTKSGNSRFRVEAYNPSGKTSTCHVAALKVERGQKASPWYPSVNDLLKWRLNDTRTNLVNLYDCKDTSNEIISFKYPGDGSIIINGTNSDKVVPKFSYYQLATIDIHTLVGNTVIFSGYDEEKMSSSTCYICYRFYDKDFNDLQYEATIERKFYHIPSKAYYAVLIFYTMNECVVDNVVVKPFISTNLLMTYDTFVPYTGPTGYLSSDIAEMQKELYQLKNKT